MKSEEGCENDIFIITIVCGYKATYIKTVFLPGYACI